MSDLEAKHLVDALGLTAAESLFERAVSRVETEYGSGWGVGAGAGSNNMGATTTVHPDALSFQHKDSINQHGTVEEYTTWFGGWPTAAAGFAGLRDILLKENVRDALAAGSWPGAVFAMYVNGYFKGVHQGGTAEGDKANISDYRKRMAGALKLIARGTGETDMSDAMLADAGFAALPPLTLLVVGGVLLYGLARLGRWRFG